MKNILWFCVAAALLAALPISAGAGVYRCKVGDKVVYQDSPCLGLQGEIKLSPNAAPPQPMDQLRAEIRAMTDKIEVANREAEQARQARLARLDAARANIAGIANNSRAAHCQNRLSRVQRIERTAADRARLPYSGNRDTRWSDLASAAREGYQADCR